MKKEEMLKVLTGFGITSIDLCKRSLGIDSEKICEDVVIAPVYNVEALKNADNTVIIDNLYHKYYSVYNVGLGGKNITYINSNIGAGNIAEILFSLTGSSCKNIYFIGSAGSVVKDINIGEITIPTECVIGDGACRYFNGGDDLFGLVTTPTKTMVDKVTDVCKQLGVKYTKVKNFSVDTISGQFMLMDYILKSGSKTIEMETASLFYVANLLKYNVVAIHNISDNSILSKSLYSGRSEAERQAKRHTQNFVIPKILMRLLK